MDTGQVRNQAVLPSASSVSSPLPAITAHVPSLKIESAASNSQYSWLSTYGLTYCCDCWLFAEVFSRKTGHILHRQMESAIFIPENIHSGGCTKYAQG